MQTFWLKHDQALINVNWGSFVNFFTVSASMYSANIIIYGSPFISSSLEDSCFNQFSFVY